MLKKIVYRRIIRRIRHFPAFIFEAMGWEYESCQRCGSAFRVMWSVDDNIWNKVTGENDGGGGSYCVDCFIKIAEAKNIIIEPNNIKLSLFYPLAKEKV